MKLSVGQKVRWSSTSSGTRRFKEGVIVYVIPPGTRPASFPERTLLPEIEKDLQKQGLKVTTRFLGGGTSRDAESYLVAVPGATQKAAQRLYWPQVHWLETV